eukprot:scaffold44025_cov58-Phaeocystis_antarctica.AAC.3
MDEKNRPEGREATSLDRQFGTGGGRVLGRRAAPVDAQLAEGTARARIQLVGIPQLGIVIVDRLDVKFLIQPGATCGVAFGNVARGPPRSAVLFHDLSNTSPPIFAGGGAPRGGPRKL